MQLEEWEFKKVISHFSNLSSNAWTYLLVIHNILMNSLELYCLTVLIDYTQPFTYSFKIHVAWLWRIRHNATLWELHQWNSCASCLHQAYGLVKTPDRQVKEAQLCPTLCDLRDYTVHGILQARILEWAAFPFSRGSSGPRNRTRVFCTAGGFFTKTGKEKDYEDIRKGEVNPCNSDWTQTQSKPMVF